MIVVYDACFMLTLLVDWWKIRKLVALWTNNSDFPLFMLSGLGDQALLSNPQNSVFLGICPPPPTPLPHYKLCISRFTRPFFAPYSPQRKHLAKNYFFIGIIQERVNLSCIIIVINIKDSFSLFVPLYCSRTTSITASGRCCLPAGHHDWR